MATVEQLTIQFKGKGAPALTRSLNTLSAAMNRLAGIQNKANKANNKYNEGMVKTHRNTEAINGAFGKFGKTMSGVRSKMLIVAFAAGAVAKVFASLHKAVSEFQVAQGKLNAVLESTGRVSGQTASQLEDMANALQVSMGVANTTIMEVQARLLTFTKIVGTQFDETTKTIIDMSAVLGTDLNQAAIQVGKALNDPIQGIGALSRVGVSFTKQQKEQIKAFQDSGDIISAQKMILAELKREFGGASKAIRENAINTRLLADVQNQWGDALREIGKTAEGLITVLLGMAKGIVWLTEKTFKVINAYTKWRATFEETGQLIQFGTKDYLKLAEAQGTASTSFTEFRTGMADFSKEAQEAAKVNKEWTSIKDIQKLTNTITQYTTDDKRKEILDQVSEALLNNTQILQVNQTEIEKHAEIEKKAADKLKKTQDASEKSLIAKFEAQQRILGGAAELTEVQKLEAITTREITQTELDYAKALDIVNGLIREQTEAEKEKIEVEKEQEEIRSLMVEARQQAMDMINEGQDRKIERAKEIADAEIAEIHRVRDEELHSLRASWKYQKATDAQKKQLEKEVTDRHKKSENEARKVANKQMAKAFKVKQAVDIANTIMSTQAAVMKTLAEGGGFWSTPQAMIVAAMGAMSVAAIASQTPPTMQYGGLVGGNRHSQGGTMIEAEQGEFVVSRAGVDATGLEALNRINSGGGGGGGASITINNPIIGKDTIEDEIVPQIKEALRRGGDIGV